MMRGKLVLVPFPFDDLSGRKVRPAVCLTEPVGPYRHVVLAFVTSSLASQLLPTDLVVEDTHPDFAATGLKASSAIQLHRLLTVSTSVILRELGELSAELQADADRRLRRVLALE